MPRFDHVVLTAANPTQAAGYEAEILARREAGLLDRAVTVHVVADPGGRRVGSLGATLHVLKRLVQTLAGEADRAPRRLEECFAGRHILICHSGGDSRRTPAYAAQGKVFVPLPAPACNGQNTTLFDLLLANMEHLPAPDGGQVLICVGDVLLTFDPKAVDFRSPGVTGVAYAGPMERGEHHGVYVTDSDAMRPGRWPVRDFLQKPDAEAARRRGALDAVGRVLIDTGLLSLDAAAVARILGAAGVRLRRGRIAEGTGLLRDVEQGACPSLDLYEELTMALAPGIPLAPLCRERAGRAGASGVRRRLGAFCRALRGLPFSVSVLPYCEFFHVGRSRELLANFSPLSRTAETYRFSNFEGSVVADGASVEGSFVFNTIVTHRQVRATGSVLEAVHADVPIELPGRNILVGLPPGGKVAVRLAEDLGLVCLPVGRSDWTAVLYGLDDDFKTARTDGVCRFLNRPIDEWLRERGLRPLSLWGRGARQDLWEARLWPVGRLTDALRVTLGLQPGHRLPHAWPSMRRLTMAELLASVNHDRLLTHRREILRRTSILRLSERLLADDRLPAETVAGSVRSGAEAGEALARVAEAMRSRPEPLFRARMLSVAERIVARHRPTPAACAPLGARSGKEVRKAALGAVAEAVTLALPLEREPRPAAVLEDQVVWVTTPVRLDFSGGWSDTPPISTELGGTVLNAAVTLNGQYPVQVMAKLNNDGVIRLSSIDLGQRVEIRTTADLLDHSDPTHWAALPKAALVLAGVGPSMASERLSRWLHVLGGGIDLTIFSALPKGSGLGTSSILGAAVLACLGRVFGQSLPLDRLAALTSALEQYMRTGGGWQDQVGGIVPGVKLIRTRPGPDQSPSLSWTVFDMAVGSELRDRLLLYYTGQKRMARDILQNIVMRYLGRDPLILRTVEELKELAGQMKADLDARDVAAFARGIERYWTLKKQIDPGSTNRQTEQILRRVDRWTAGRVLPGAGGGGFVLFVARDAQAACRIRHELTVRPPNASARFFDFDVDQTGLKVTVL